MTNFVSRETLWCPRPDSNRHAFRQQILSLSCLPFHHRGNLLCANFLCCTYTTGFVPVVFNTIWTHAILNAVYSKPATHFKVWSHNGHKLVQLPGMCHGQCQTGKILFFYTIHFFSTIIKNCKHTDFARTCT